MFNRFTHEAKTVVVLAQESARMLNHDYIGTEHLLMALTHRNAGAASILLEVHKITGDAVESAITDIVGLGLSAHGGTLRMTLRARHALGRADVESMDLTHSEVTPVHLLLALLHQSPATEGSVSSQVIRHVGSEPEKLKADALLFARGGDAVVRQALEAFAQALRQAVDAPEERLAEAMNAALRAAGSAAA